MASRFLEDVSIEPDHLPGVLSAFSVAQTSVLAESRSMLARLGRPNYVTPTHYLELTQGYKVGRQAGHPFVWGVWLKVKDGRRNASK